ncbi:MAG: hypothetical protein JEY99_16995 [Spirochaetales bacterium]|nr:hypothetical protein [Spirochaetales bacterium]
MDSTIDGTLVSKTLNPAQNGVRKRVLSLFLLFCILILTFSCSSRQEIAIDLSGEGTGSMEITLHPVLTSYLADLSMVMSDTDESQDTSEISVFDEVGIWNGFALNNSIDLVSVDIPKPNQLKLEWTFSDLNEPFLDSAGSAGSGATVKTERNVLSFKKEGRLRIFEFYLAPENFYQVSKYFPLMDENLLAYFGPNPDDPVPEDIYKEDLEFALEDYLDNDSIDDILETSIISLLVKTEGKLVSNVGGRIVDRGVLFETPLIKILTLNEPVFYRLVFTEE